MKKVFSLLLLASILTLTITPSFAQEQEGVKKAEIQTEQASKEEMKKLG